MMNDRKYSLQQKSNKIMTNKNLSLWASILFFICFIIFKFNILALICLALIITHFIVNYQTNLFLISASIFLGVTLFIFNPAFIYISSPERIGELNFNGLIGLLLLPASVLVLSLSTDCLFKKQKVFTSLVVWLSLIVYVYSYLVNIDFGSFRGSNFVNQKIIFNLREQYLLPEIIVWSLLFGLIFYLVKVNKTKIFSNLFIVLGFLTLINLLHTSSSHIILQLRKNSVNSIGNNSKAIDLSQKNSNILLIVLDGGANYVLPQVFQENPNISLEGFTHYKNSVAAGDYTMANVASLIGGEKYTPYNVNKSNSKQTIYQNMLESYAWLSNILIQNKYQVNIINPPFFLELNQKNIKISYAEKYKDHVKKRYNYKEYNIFNEGLLMLFSVFKALPLSLKNTLYSSKHWERIIDQSIDSKKYLNDYLFTKSLDSLTQINNNNSHFTHIWLAASIDPCVLNSDGTERILSSNRHPIPLNARKISAKYYLMALNQWFEWMKKNNLYDNTKIIIVADHGSTDPSKNWYIGAIQPILLVKDFKERGKLKISDKLMYNADTAYIICNALKNCPKLKSSINQANRQLIYSIAEHGNYKFAEQNTKFNIEKSYLVTANTLHNPAKWEKIKQ